MDDFEDNKSFKYIKSRYGCEGILMRTRLYFWRLRAGYEKPVHPTMRFVNQRRVFDPGGIALQFHPIQ